MFKTLRVSLAWCLLTAVATWTVVAGDTKAISPKSEKELPDAKLDQDQAKFMRKKLEASAEILEGLTSENAELIIKGAKRLVEMSSAEKWHVNNDIIYRQFSGEFQRSSKSLLEAAEKKNYDAAALKWIDTTMKCLECHKFVRGARLVESDR